MAPKQKPGKSKQDYQTPPEFLAAAKAKLGILEFALDVAASVGNNVAARFWTKEQDALKQSWKSLGWSWLNPPFAHLEPWVQRAWEQSRLGARVAVLVPAGVGANWWKNWVDQKALVLLLNGRITFVGQEDAYPKDCCLLLFAPEVVAGYEVWTWPDELKEAA